MSNGLLKFLASPAGQRFGAGMKGLSAGLLQAGAPRVGAPGPNAWGAGLMGMSQGVEAEMERQKATEMAELQKRLIQQQAAKTQAEVDALNAQARRRATLFGAPNSAQVQQATAGMGPGGAGGVSANVAPSTPSVLQRYFTPNEIAGMQALDTDTVQSMVKDRVGNIRSGEADMRKEIERNVLTGVTENNVKYNRLVNVLGLKTGQGDIAAVNNYQKLVDEGVVRGEDVRLQQEAVSVFERAKQWLDQQQEGTLLPPQVRDNLAAASKVLVEVSNRAAQDRLAGYQGIANRKLFNWENIVPKEAMGVFSLDPYTKQSSAGSPGASPAPLPASAPPPPPGTVRVQ